MPEWTQLRWDRGRKIDRGGGGSGKGGGGFTGNQTDTPAVQSWAVLICHSRETSCSERLPPVSPGRIREVLLVPGYRQSLFHSATPPLYPPPPSQDSSGVRRTWRPGFVVVTSERSNWLIEPTRAAVTCMDAQWPRSCAGSNF